MARAFPSDRIYGLPGTKWNWEVHRSTISHLTGNPDVSAKYIITAVWITHASV